MSRLKERPRTSKNSVFYKTSYNNYFDFGFGSLNITKLNKSMFIMERNCNSNSLFMLANILSPRLTKNATTQIPKKTWPAMAKYFLT